MPSAFMPLTITREIINTTPHHPKKVIHIRRKVIHDFRKVIHDFRKVIHDFSYAF